MSLPASPPAGPALGPVAAAPPLPSEVPRRPPGSSPAPQKQPRSSRTGRVWVAVCAAALLAVALIVFMLQNTHTVEVNFLGMTGSTSLALMLLIAAVGAVLLTLIVGSVRIVQLRRAVRRQQR
jgi:putative membrane protein